ncbi:MAG: hypothetical protein QME96_01365 [Myxococcota bacterium]|nr:hypothetical protein [Myxococcota bacterium]
MASTEASSGGFAHARASVTAWVAAVLCLAPAGTIRPARAGDPLIEWRTVETPHFRINFPHHLERFAGRAAMSLERAHGSLVPLLGHEPEDRTEVVITDDTDDANGSATALPYNVIRLFAIPPFDFSPLQDYDDWLHMLVAHEYAHILHLDNIGWPARLVNALFGKTWAPNHVQPRFILEGVAVLIESRATGHGRVGGTIFDMYLRMATLEDALLRIDQVANGPTTWPYGEAHYLYGSYLFDFIVRRHGEEVLGKLATAYGDDILAFGINRSIEEVTGETYIELFDAWKADLRTRFGAQKAAIEAEGPTDGRRIVADAEIVRTPRFSPDGRRIGYFGYDGYGQPALFAVDPAGGRRERLRLVTGAAAMSWAPDSRGFVYHRAEPYRNYYGFYDLFAVAADGSDLRLTAGLRAREPDVDRSGRRVAFVLASPSTWSLATSRPDGSGLEIVLTAGEDAQIYTPRWSPDGRSLAFSAWLPGGRRDIYALDLESRGLVRLTHDADAINAAPAWSPDGRLLFYSSDRTGIANVYAVEVASGLTRRVTNVMGGAFHPDVSPDGRKLAFVGYTSTGYDLRVLDLDGGAWVGIDSPAPVEVESLDPEGGPVDDPVPGVARSRPYDPWQTAMPRAWSLQYAQAGVQPTLTALVQGGDVAGIHALGGTATVGLEDAEVGYQVAYSFAGWNPYLGLAHARWTRPRTDVTVDGEPSRWIEESYSARAEATLPVLSGEHAQWFTLAYAFEWLRPRGGGFDVPEDPNVVSAVPRDTGSLSGVGFHWRFSNTRGSSYALGRNYGYTLGAGLRFDHPALGSDFEVMEAGGDVAAFFSVPWARSHSIATRLAGAIGRAAFRGRGIFFLGGFPEQDFLRGILYGEAMGGVALRGYEPWSVYGSRYVLGNVEYRVPIVAVDAGPWTLPAFLRRISANAFCDVGAASWGEIRPEDVKVGAGAEILVEASIGYYLWFSLRAGYAYGFMEPGGHDFYVVLGSPF